MGQPRRYEELDFETDKEFEEPRDEAAGYVQGELFLQKEPGLESGKIITFPGNYESSGNIVDKPHNPSDTKIGKLKKELQQSEVLFSEELIFDVIAFQNGSALANYLRDNDYLDIPNIVKILEFAGKEYEQIVPYLNALKLFVDINRTYSLYDRENGYALLTSKSRHKIVKYDLQIGSVYLNFELKLYIKNNEIYRLKDSTLFLDLSTMELCIEPPSDDYIGIPLSSLNFGPDDKQIRIKKDPDSDNIKFFNGATKKTVLKISVNKIPPATLPESNIVLINSTRHPGR